jgi:hypothetical protein
VNPWLKALFWLPNGLFWPNDDDGLKLLPPDWDSCENAFPPWFANPVWLGCSTNIEGTHIQNKFFENVFYRIWKFFM